MNVHDFPSAYEQQVKKEADQCIQLAQNAHQLKAGEYAQKASQIHAGMPKSILTGRDAIFGFLITWVLEAVLVYGILQPLGAGDSLPLIMLLFWIVGTLVIGLYLNRRRRRSVAAKLTELEKEMEEESRKLAESNAAIQKNAAAEVEAYRLAFEEEARKMSLRFAESELADQVVDWAMGHLSKVIDSADRSAHIEQIAVTAALGVHPTLIIFSASEDRAGYPGYIGDVFDFEKNRCRALVSPLEQAALAHVLASKMQLAIMMKYPQDPSGSVPDVTTIEVAVSGTATANIQYHAANLNYQAVKNW